VKLTAPLSFLFIIAAFNLGKQNFLICPLKNGHLLDHNWI